MEVEYAFLARYAEPSGDGTLNIMGADLGTIRFRLFPGFVPALSVVVKLKPTSETPTRFRCKIVLPEDPNREPIFSTGSDWQTASGNPRKQSSATSGTRLVITIPMLEIPRAGQYDTIVELSGGPRLHLPMMVAPWEE